MFIQHSVHITRSIDACTEALESAAHTWYPGLIGGKDTLVGIHVAGVPLRKQVDVVFGTAVKEASWTSIPFTWKATGPAVLFPEMVGTVQLAPVDPTVTRLTVNGMYSAPLGRIGQEIDRAVMHRVADATIKEITESMAQVIKGALSNAAPAPA